MTMLTVYCKAKHQVAQAIKGTVFTSMFCTNRISLYKCTTWSLGSKLTHQVNSHLDQQILWQKDNYVLSALSSVVIDKHPVKRTPPKRRDQQKQLNLKLLYHSCGKKYSRRDLFGYDHCSKRMHKSQQETLTDITTFWICPSHKNAVRVQMTPSCIQGKHGVQHCNSHMHV